MDMEKTKDGNLMNLHPRVDKHVYKELKVKSAMCDYSMEYITEAGIILALPKSVKELETIRNNYRSKA